MTLRRRINAADYTLSFSLAGTNDLSAPVGVQARGFIGLLLQLRIALNSALLEIFPARSPYLWALLRGSFRCRHCKWLRLKGVWPKLE